MFIDVETVYYGGGVCPIKWYILEIKRNGIKHFHWTGEENKKQSPEEEKYWTRFNLIGVEGEVKVFQTQWLFSRK